MPVGSDTSDANNNENKVRVEVGAPARATGTLARGDRFKREWESQEEGAVVRTFRRVLLAVLILGSSAASGNFLGRMTYAEKVASASLVIVGRVTRNLDPTASPAIGPSSRRTRLRPRAEMLGHGE